MLQPQLSLQPVPRKPDLHPPDYKVRTRKKSLNFRSFPEVNPQICIQLDKLLSVIYGCVNVPVAPVLVDFYTLPRQMTTQAATLVFPASLWEHTVVDYGLIQILHIKC